MYSFKKSETAENPNSALLEDNDDDEKWRVLYTRSRHEKFVEDQLLQKRVEAFTPKVNIRRSWSDRIKLIEEPLFKGYCFAKFSLKDKVKIISQLGVAGLVHFNRQYIAVEESVISSLKILTANDVKVDYHPYLNVGDKVFIKTGPLKGLEGYIIEKINKNTTIVISVGAIHSSIKFITDACFAEAA